MRDLEGVRGKGDASSSANARERLGRVLASAHERRAKLERQLATANEFGIQLS